MMCLSPRRLVYTYWIPPRSTPLPGNMYAVCINACVFYGIQGYSLTQSYTGALFNFKPFTSPLPVYSLYTCMCMCIQPVLIRPNDTQPGVLLFTSHNPALQTSYSHTLSHLPIITILSYKNPIGEPTNHPHPCLQKKVIICV